jgi:thiamine transport system ATP-binding protein
VLQLESLGLVQGDFALSADLALPAGGVTAVIGPSGGGKSTLLGAIAGFVVPAQGRILWEGRDLAGLAPGQRPVSILFQDGNLFAHLTLAQNLGLALVPRLRLTPDQTGRVVQALEEVGLGGLGDRRPGQMSGGQAARAALARVLLARRPLVLMDEPFGALGPALKAEMMALARERVLARGGTLVLVTHQPQDARAVADRVVVVAEGRVSGPWATGPLLDDPPAALAAYLGASGLT